MIDKHPMRDIPITIFQRIEGDGPAFISKFEPFKEYPIFFTGTTADEVRKSAKDFAEEAVAKNEEKFLARQVALEKARAARAKKKGKSHE